jgi:hypothetical protein
MVNGGKASGRGRMAGLINVGKKAKGNGGIAGGMGLMPGVGVE